MIDARIQSIMPSNDNHPFFYHSCTWNENDGTYSTHNRLLSAFASAYANAAYGHESTSTEMGWPSVMVL